MDFDSEKEYYRYLKENGLDNNLNLSGNNFVKGNGQGNVMIGYQAGTVLPLYSSPSVLRLVKG